MVTSAVISKAYLNTFDKSSSATSGVRVKSEKLLPMRCYVLYRARLRRMEQRHVEKETMVLWSGYLDAKLNQR